MRALPTLPAHRLPATAPDARWLLEELWAYDAVGILGGEPKCCKSLCALSIALAVANGSHCLGGHTVGRSGPVLHFAAEDALHIVRDRLERLALGLGGIDLASLPLHIITAPTVRIDRDEDCRALEATIVEHRPVLVILDPFVRLHRCDENASGEVAPLLAFLRLLQRRHNCALILVHHARKGGGARAGQALRGSSELHAWGDCNLYLRRRKHTLTLEAEHRAAAAPDPITLELATCGPDNTGLVLRPTTATGRTADRPASTADRPDPPERILAILRQAAGPMSRKELQQAARMRTQDLGTTLRTLVADGRLKRIDGAYHLPAPPLTDQ